MNDELHKNDMGSEGSAPENESQMKSPKHDSRHDAGSSGALVGTAVILILIIIGGFYLWTTKVPEVQEADQLPTIQSGGETEAIINQLETQGTSDEISDIEADLNATDLESLDSELDQLLDEF